MSGDRAGRAFPVTLAWLIHPVTLASLILLLINDHLLKAAYPGPLTGKLSDVAGLVLLPPVLATIAAALAVRLPAGRAAAGAIVATAVGFTLVKASRYAAEVASAAWSAVVGPSVIRADWTDLLTVPALGVAGWAYLRVRDRPVCRRTVRRLGSDSTQTFPGWRSGRPRRAYAGS